MRLTQLLPGHGAHARRPGDRIERGRRREIDAITLETGDALLIGAGPALVPGDVDVMGDLVAVDGVGAAVAGHAAKQRFHLCGGAFAPAGLRRPLPTVSTSMRPSAP